MAFIRLTHGFFARVDDEDFERLNNHTWHYAPQKKGAYARTNVFKDGRTTTVYLHRMVMRAEVGDLIDHINQDKLDCRKRNLRFASRTLNGFNQSPSASNKAGCRGVNYEANSAGRKRWRARVRIQKRLWFSGRFHTKEEAIAARNEWEDKVMARLAAEGHLS